MKIYMGRGKNIFIFLIYSLPFALCFALLSLQRLKVNPVAFLGCFFPYFSSDAAAFLHCCAAEECSSSRQFLAETLKQFKCWVCDTQCGLWSLLARGVAAFPPSLQKRYFMFVKVS